MHQPAGPAGGTRSRGSKQMDPMDTPPIGDVNLPLLLEPAMANLLLMYSRSRKELYDSFSLTSSFLYNAYDKAIQFTIEALDRRVSILLLVGPLYSGRLLPAHRNEYSHRLKQSIEELTDVLKKNPGQSLIGYPFPSLQTLLPPADVLGDEQGYHDPTPFSTALDKLELALNHARNTKRERENQENRISSQLQELQRHSSDVEKEITKKQDRLKQDLSDADHNRQIAVKEVEANKKTMQTNYDQWERDEEMKTISMIKEVCDQQRLELERIEQRRKESIYRLLLKRKVVYFIYKSSDLHYVRPWLNETLPHPEVTIRHLDEGWFPQCTLPGAVLVVCFLEEKSNGMADRDVECVCQIITSAKSAGTCEVIISLKSTGKCSNAAIVRLQPATSATSPQTIGEERLSGCTNLCGQSCVIYGQLRNQQEQDMLKRVIASDRDEWNTASAMQRAVARVAKDDVE